MKENIFSANSNFILSKDSDNFQPDIKRFVKDLNLLSIITKILVESMMSGCDLHQVYQHTTW